MLGAAALRPGPARPEDAGARRLCGCAERSGRARCPANRDVRIVAYTSEPAHLASVKTQKAGMDGFVSKPCAQLPLVEALHAGARPSQRPRRAGAALAGRRVLLADDNPFNRKAVAAYLKHAGATVIEAAHGRAVLEHLQRARRLGRDPDGPQHAGHGRAGNHAGHPRAAPCPGSHVPIMALTAHSDQATVQAAQAAGMNGLHHQAGRGGRALREHWAISFSGATAATSQPMPAGAAAAHRTTRAGCSNLDRLESYRRIGMLRGAAGRLPARNRPAGRAGWSKAWPTRT